MLTERRQMEIFKGNVVMTKPCFLCQEREGKFCVPNTGKGGSRLIYKGGPPSSTDEICVTYLARYGSEVQFRAVRQEETVESILWEFRDKYKQAAQDSE